MAEMKEPKPGTVPIPFLRLWREYKLMSRAALAMAAGITEPAIEKIEAGRTTAARFSTAKKLATALGISPEDLLYHKPPTREGERKQEDA